MGVTWLTPLLKRCVQGLAGCCLGAGQSRHQVLVASGLSWCVKAVGRNSEQLTDDVCGRRPMTTSVALEESGWLAEVFAEWVMLTL